jgi:hypothetical protein
MDNKIEILGVTSKYTFPVIAGTHKGGSARLEKGPKSNSKIVVSPKGASQTIERNFRTVSGASEVYGKLTGINVEGLPSLTKGKPCKCGKNSRPINVTNFREDPKGKEYPVCLRCGGKIR